VKEFRRVARGDEKRALLDGWHLLNEAVRAHIAIEHLAVATNAERDSIHELMREAETVAENVWTVSPRVMEVLSPVRTPTGVCAVVQRRQSTLSQLLTPDPALVVLAVDMQDPGNVGAVIRSAEAGGATGVFVAGGSSDAWGWKALRAAMGSTFRLPVLAVDQVVPRLDELREHGVTVLATVPRDGAALHQTDLRGAVAVMIGGEGRGLSDKLIDSADRTVSIPMKPPVESLNAAVAAALVVYEARRQREVGL
jgi:TrmH family RNA methyltransferase